MIYICIICTSTKPSLLILSDEHRQILEAIVSPTLNLAKLNGFQLWICESCKCLISTVETFKNIALVGTSHLLTRLESVQNEQDEQLQSADPQPLVNQDPDELLQVKSFVKFEIEEVKVNPLGLEDTIKTEYDSDDHSAPTTLTNATEYLEPATMTSEAQGMPSRKRKASPEVNINKQLMQQWLEEDIEFSDVEDDVAEKDIFIEQVHEESEISAEESSENEDLEPTVKNENKENEGERFQEESVSNNRGEMQSKLQASDGDCYRGRNGFVWSKTEFSNTSRTLHNISSPKQNDQKQYPGYEKNWNLFFDSEMIETLVTCTNKNIEVYRLQFSDNAKQELKDTSDLEIRCLLGLLYYSSVFKSNDADSNCLFGTDGTSHEIFRCAMSKNRFNTLINCLRLDNVNNRKERLKFDPLCAVSLFFNKFIANCQSHYTPGPYVCNDETLLAFRGCCAFLVCNNKSKSVKYGIKIMVLADACQSYVYNAYIYHGKGSDGIGLSEAEKKLAAPTQ